MKINAPLFKSYTASSAVANAVTNVCESGYLNEGVQVAELEAALSVRLDAPYGHATLVNSCTSALELALRLANVEHDDIVITTSMTCLATNTPIVNAGANIVWADINPNTGCIDPQSVADRLAECRDLNKRVKAVICVNWAGNVCDLQALEQVCAQYRVKLIQDAAHSFGATYMNKQIARYADFTCFSFQAIKHFTTGDGGMLVCRDAKDHARGRRLKWFGLDRDAAKDPRGDWKGQQWDVDVVEAGRKMNMNNIAAAIGLANLSSINWILLRHRTNAQTYDRMFTNTEIVPLQKCSDGKQLSSSWVYTVRVDPSKRDKLLERLNTHGIKAGLVHVPNHNYTCFAQSRRELPGTQEFAASQLSLPCGWWVDQNIAEEIAYITLEELRAL